MKIKVGLVLIATVLLALLGFWRSVGDKESKACSVAAQAGLRQVYEHLISAAKTNRNVVTAAMTSAEIRDTRAQNRAFPGLQGSDSVRIAALEVPVATTNLLILIKPRPHISLGLRANGTCEEVLPDEAAAWPNRLFEGDTF